MLFFGHIGITAGVACLSEALISSSGSEDRNSYTWLNGLKSWVGQVDYRLVILGSLLPDIIDKPIFLLVKGNSLSGRDYAHGLLFSLVLLIIGLSLIRFGKPRILTVSLSSMMHLVFDQIWNNPVTLFWPLLGPLRGEEVADWLPGIFYGLLNSPGTYIPEIVGLIVLIILTYRLVKMKDMTRFIREGIMI